MNLSLTGTGRRLLTLFALVALSSCHANILYRIDVHPNNIATVTVREVLDNQLYAMAGSSGGSDPFALALARKQGWKVAQQPSPDGGMAIQLVRDIPVSQLSNALSGTVSSAASQVAPISVPKFLITHRSGFLSNQIVVHTVFPAFLKKPGVEMSSIGASMAASVISMQLQLRAPGKITSTNGTKLANGFVQWTISPISSTSIDYAVDMPNGTTVTILVLAGAALLIIVVGLYLVNIRRPKAGPSP